MGLVYCQMNRQYKNIKRLNSMLDKLDEMSYNTYK